MNTRLLRRVAKHIAAEPLRYNQNSTLRTDVLDEMNAPPCGTVGCIGGWVCALTGKTPRSRRKFAWHRARRELRITNSQADKLFGYTWASFGGWPAQFKYAYEEASTPQERVKIAVARIEHFIKTKGVE